MSQDLPTRLYTACDLLDGYKPHDADGFTASWDFGVFRQYVVDGAETPKSFDIRQRQADHDAYMAEALKRFLSQDPPPKLAGLMGGHGLTRAAPAYQDVARLTKRLAEEGVDERQRLGAFGRRSGRSPERASSNERSTANSSLIPAHDHSSSIIARKAPVLLRGGQSFPGSREGHTGQGRYS